MKKINVIFVGVSLIFILISTANFVSKFILKDCDPSKLFDNENYWINNSNIHFYNGARIASFIFSVLNIIFVASFGIYLYFIGLKNKLVPTVYIPLVMVMNMTWIVFESVIQAGVPNNMCYVHITNLIESSVAICYWFVTACFCIVMIENKQQTNYIIDF